MSKFSVAIKRFGGFLKRNAFYLLVLLCIASIATVIALAVTYNSGMNGQDLNVSDDTPVVKPDDPGQQQPSDGDDTEKEPSIPEKKLTFISPCNGSVMADYSAKAVFNESMQDYRVHKGIDFVSDDLNVFASCDGKVKETGYSRLDGYYIVLEHDDGYQTKYMSLESASDLKVGATVEQGQLIGKMASTQGTEAAKQAHLHFEMFKDGVRIDPVSVLVLDEK